MFVCSSLYFALLLGAPLVAAQRSDIDEVRAYRLTMPKIQQLAAATKALQALEAKDPSAQALKRAKAELEKLEAKEVATEGDEARMEQLIAEIERLENGDDDDDSIIETNAGESLADMVRSIERQPQVVTALRSAGLTPREFSVLQLSLMQAALHHGMMKAGLLKTLPKDANPENVAFMKQHEAELEKLLGSLEPKDR